MKEGRNKVEERWRQVGISYCNRVMCGPGFADFGALPGSMLGVTAVPDGIAACTQRRLAGCSLSCHPGAPEQPERLAAAGAGEHRQRLGRPRPRPDSLHQLTSHVAGRVHGPSLAGLSSSNLQRLELSRCAGIDPRALAPHTQLKQLGLNGCCKCSLLAAPCSTLSQQQRRPP